MKADRGMLVGVRGFEFTVMAEAVRRRPDGCPTIDGTVVKPCKDETFPEVEWKQGHHFSGLLFSRIFINNRGWWERAE